MNGRVGFGLAQSFFSSISRGYAQCPTIKIRNNICATCVYSKNPYFGKPSCSLLCFTAVNLPHVHQIGNGKAVAFAIVQRFDIFLEFWVLRKNRLLKFVLRQLPYCSNKGFMTEENIRSS